MSVKFIKLYKKFEDTPILINVDHIIDISDIMETCYEYEEYEYEDFEWRFLFWKGPVVKKTGRRRKYVEEKPTGRSLITTTDINPIKTNYRFAADTMRSYQTGGDNVTIEVQQSPEQIMNLINRESQ